MKIEIKEIKNSSPLLGVFCKPKLSITPNLHPFSLSHYELLVCKEKMVLSMFYIYNAGKNKIHFSVTLP